MADDSIPPLDANIGSISYRVNRIAYNALLIGMLDGGLPAFFNLNTLKSFPGKHENFGEIAHHTLQDIRNEIA